MSSFFNSSWMFSMQHEFCWWFSSNIECSISPLCFWKFHFSNTLSHYLNNIFIFYIQWYVFEHNIQLSSTHIFVLYSSLIHYILTKVFPHFTFPSLSLHLPSLQDPLLWFFSKNKKAVLLGIFIKHGLIKYNTTKGKISYQGWTKLPQ